MKKYGVILILILLLGIILYSYKPLLSTLGADSGWDSSYDSGSSSSSSSFSWSDNSYDNDSYHSKNSHHSSKPVTTEEALLFELVLSIFYYVYLKIFLPVLIKKAKPRTIINITVSIIRLLIVGTIIIVKNDTKVPTISMLILFILVMAAVIIAFINKIVTEIKFITSNNSVDKARKRELKLLDYKYSEYLKGIGINPKELKKELYNNFIEVQLSWMNFDYNKLKLLCSSELYNSYKKDLEILSLKNGKNIMKNFYLKDIKIENVQQIDNLLEVSIYLDIIFRDFVINDKTKRVIRGKRFKIMHNKYHLVYRKNTKVLLNCPTCGAPIQGLSNDTCPNCGTFIPNNNSNFVLSLKERI